MKNNTQHSSSFRDPSGYIFTDKNEIRRVINPIYFKTYNALKDTGFFNKLFNAKLLIPHTELDNSEEKITIKPEQIPFITYPYEWSFNMYKDAALLTLKLQKYSLEHGFSLKDASAFNVTFHKGKAIFIDTLSFDFYTENSPWRAYKQFISHFFGPLLLAHYHGANHLKLLSTFIDGLPLEMISSLLPFKTKFNPTIYTNIHLLAKLETKYAESTTSEVKQPILSKKGQLKIIENLYDFIKNLTLKDDTEWGAYYNKINYSDTAFKEKKQLINAWVSQHSFKTIIDMGGNDGTFVNSISSTLNLAIVSDIDTVAIDVCHSKIRKDNIENRISMVLDVLNPTPAVGFKNDERFSFIQRVKALQPSAVFALALIHHMTLSGNVPFENSASFFSSLSNYLIIEFPKREDSWVQKLLNDKAEFKSHFDFYTLENFKLSYSKYYTIIIDKAIDDSERVLFLLERKC